MNRVLYIYEGGNEVMEYVESFREAKTSGWMEERLNFFSRSEDRKSIYHRMISNIAVLSNLLFQIFLNIYIFLNNISNIVSKDTLIIYFDWSRDTDRYTLDNLK